MVDINHVLLTSAGRRSYLVEYFRTALDNEGTVSATDCDPLAPVFSETDLGFIVPRIDEKNYLQTLLQLCEEFDVDVLVPTNDRELPLFATARKDFESIDTHVVVSSERCIDVANDKIKTYEFLSQHDIPTPYTIKNNPKERISTTTNPLEYPVIVKPRFGSGSQEVYVASSEKELEVFWNRIDDPIVQEYIDMQEYGIDVFNDKNGTPVSIVPREKIATRAGETDKAIAVHELDLIEIGREVGHQLGHYGPLDIDCFYDGSDVYVMELNARFGGGYPLTHLAGGAFVREVLSLAARKEVTERVGEFTEGTYMVKDYDVKMPVDETDLIQRK